ncbi:MAG: thioredoxin domain-containing protein [Myxococcota bacterium]|nr:thioredoxin domain-containing protein [Myxococcota bacterium]
MENQQEKPVAKHQHAGGAGLVVAAIILGGCILGAGFLMAQATERAGDRIVPGIADPMKVATAPAPAPRREARARRGPDPAKRYTVDLKGAPAIGPEDAAVTVVEFSDFQCPFCARVLPTLDQIRNEYGDQVRVVFKHLPLSFHQKAPAAHAASEAAHKQGKFWEMHDKIFKNQRQMSEANYVVWAGEIGLDVETFKKDMASAAIKARVDQDVKEAGRLGVTGTPGFFINGRHMSGAKPFSEFKVVIDEEIKKEG